MQLQRRGRHGSGHWSLERSYDRARLRLPACDQKQFPGHEDRAESLRDRRCRWLSAVRERASVVAAGLLAEPNDACAAGKRRAWFIECDMTVGTDAEKLELDAGRTDTSFVAGAFGVQIQVVGIRCMHGSRREISGLNEQSVDGVRERTWIVGLEADVLVEQIHLGTSQAQRPPLAAAGDLGERPFHCFTGGYAEHRRRSAADESLDDVRRAQRCRSSIRSHEDLHR